MQFVDIGVTGLSDKAMFELILDKPGPSCSKLTTLLHVVKLASAVAATTRKCRRGLLITGQLFICLPGVC